MFWYVRSLFNVSVQSRVHYRGKYLYLPPANEVCEGYVYTCLSVHRGGLPQWHDGIPPGKADPPNKEIPPPMHSACWEIRSTSGRYAFSWNAILYKEYSSFDTNAPTTSGNEMPNTFFGGHQPFLWGHWYALLVTSSLGFKARVVIGYLVSMLWYPRIRDSSDSPLVRHLLTSWWSA